MSVKVYKCINQKLPGALYLRFENEDLTHIELAFSKGLKADQWGWIKERLPQHLHQLPELAEGFEVAEIAPKSVREKLIMFCSYYKHYRQVAYQAKMEEKNNLKSVQVSDKLLKTFFESPLVDFSMANYIKRYNITKDLAQNGRKTPAEQSNKMPDHWDRDYERKLEGQELTKYHQHLHSLGWRKRYNPAGGTTWHETDH